MALLTLPRVLQLVLTVAVIFLVYKLVAWLLSIQGPNPFAKDSRKPPRPLVTDMKQRDAVLQESFATKKIPADLDAIFIGSGIGSLSAAAVLAKAGKKCLVLEQNDQAGGCCHTFIEKGYEFEVGIHYIGKMNKQTITKTLCDQITDGQLQWAPMDDEFETVVFGFNKDAPRYPVFGSASKWRASLKEHFPGEEAAIDKFLDKVSYFSGAKVFVGVLKVLPLWLSKLILKLGIHEWITVYWKYTGKTIEQFVNPLTNNKTLRAMFLYNFESYGCPPSKGPSAMQFEAHDHYLKCGASYPVGGPSEIAFHIIPVIESAGGKVLVRARVSNILIDDRGRAVGVQVEKGSQKVNVYAKTVISDAGVHSTFGCLLPKDVAENSYFYKFLTTIEPSISFVSAFIGLNSPSSELNLKSQNVIAFSHTDFNKIFHELTTLSLEEVMDKELPMIFISFSSMKDPTWDSRYPGKSTITAHVLAPYSWFAKWENKPVLHRGEDYEERKQMFGQKIKDRIFSLYPELKDKVDYFNIGTPLSYRHYIAKNNGEAYGLKYDANRLGPVTAAELRPKTDIPGLYITGQDVMYASFVGALFGGLLCATSVLNRNLFLDLRKIHRETKNRKFCMK